jgi:hypothetical protein
VLVRVPDYLRNAGKRRDLIGRPLCVTSGNNDFALWILPLDAPDRGTGVLLSRGSNRAGIEYYPFGAG